MKKFTVFVLTIFVCVAIKAQEIPARFYFNFDDGKIPDNITGVSFVDASRGVMLKGDFKESPAQANKIEMVEGSNALWTDYEGYIQFDNSVFDVKSFSVSFKCKYETQPVAWLGLLSVTGNDPDGWDDAMGGGFDPGYTDRRTFQIRYPKQNDGTNEYITWHSNQSAVVADKGAGTFNPDTYYHITLTSENGLGRIYVDGVLVSEIADNEYHTLTDAKIFIGIRTTMDLATGSFTPATYDGHTKNVRMYLDDVALFNKALSTTEVEDIYAGTSIPTGIRDAKVSSDAVYPNPMDEMLFVKEQGIIAIDIYSIAGAKVLSSANVSAGVNVSSLSRGVYLVNCMDENGQVIAVQKAIKK